MGPVGPTGPRGPVGPAAQAPALTPSMANNTAMPSSALPGRLRPKPWSSIALFIVEALASGGQALKKTSAPQAAALENTLEMLGKCYREQPAGAEVTVMQGLAALISPERNGLYAEKLAQPDTTAHCLPA